MRGSACHLPGARCRSRSAWLARLRRLAPPIPSHRMEATAFILSSSAMVPRGLAIAPSKRKRTRVHAARCLPRAALPTEQLFDIAAVRAAPDFLPWWRPPPISQHNGDIYHRTSRRLRRSASASPQTVLRPPREIGDPRWTFGPRADLAFRIAAAGRCRVPSMARSSTRAARNLFGRAIRHRRRHLRPSRMARRLHGRHSLASLGRPQGSPGDPRPRQLI